MSEEFKIIDTQEAFDSAIKSRLEHNTKTVTEEVTKKFEGWLSPEDVTKQISGLSGKIKENEQIIADLTAKNKAYENSLIKIKIAFETGLPFELSERLSGETEKEIRADAEKLAGYVNSAKKPSPKFFSELPPNDSQKTALLSMLRKLNNNN